MTTTPEEALREAADGENTDLIAILRDRCVRLRAEVLLRDARIVELEAALRDTTREGEDQS